MISFYPLLCSPRNKTKEKEKASNIWLSCFVDQTDKGRKKKNSLNESNNPFYPQIK